MYVNLKCPICGEKSIKRHDAKTCGKAKCQKARQRKIKRKESGKQKEVQD